MQYIVDENRIDHDFAHREASIKCKFCSDIPFQEIVYQSLSTNVVASIGALVEGWTLVFPVKHVLSLAGLEAGEWLDFQRDLTKIKESVENKFGPVVLFEHGSAGAGRTAGCGVDHAHMHIVPLNFDLRISVEKISNEVGKYEWTKVKTRPASRPGFDYIYLSDKTGSWITYAPLLPSQVIRRAIANEIGADEWDWKKDNQSERMLRVAATLRGR